MRFKLLIAFIALCAFWGIIAFPKATLRPFSLHLDINQTEESGFYEVPISTHFKLPVYEERQNPFMVAKSRPGYANLYEEPSSTCCPVPYQAELKPCCPLPPPCSQPVALSPSRPCCQSDPCEDNIIFLEDWSPFPFPKTIALRTSDGDGIGYCNGYSSLSMLMGPDPCPGHFLPMLDLRFTRIYESANAFNAGLLFRYISPCCVPVFGFNVYYDYREGNLGNYQSIGFGMEVLNDRWDARINAYVPLSTSSRMKVSIYDQYEGGYYIITRQYEYAFHGVNAELGYNFVNCENFKFYAAAGPYYLYNSYRDTWGAMLRVRNQYKDYLALELSVSYDEIFQERYQAELIFTLPLYRLCCKKRTCCDDALIYQPVRRFDIIPLLRKTTTESNF